MKGLIPTFIILLTIIISGGFPARADSSAIEIVNTYNLTEKDISDGDIVSSTSKGLIKSLIANDSHLFGVIAQNPLVVYRNTDRSGVPISRNGITNVNVTTFGGEIKRGDFITSSEIPGKGQKAVASSYVIGAALEDFNGKNGTEISFKNRKYMVGKIAVGMRIEYADINSPRTFKRLFDLVGSSFFSSVSDPDKFGLMARYITAGLAILAAILFAFLTFSRSIPRAVEAIGRNPLAKSSIYLSLAVSVGGMLAVIALGIIGAFVMMKL